LACAELTGCPGLKHVQTDYGRKMDTDITWCVNDGACERIRACSAFEAVTIKRKRPPRSRVPELGLDEIPEPEKRPVGGDSSGWRCCLAGVGGMGIGVATSILVRAAHKEGYEVIFVDKKGLAIRNGSVVSQVVYNLRHEPVTAIIPYGKADLLIGIDILEAARALDPQGRARVASPERTAAVINTDKVLTIHGLMGEEDFDVEELERIVRRHTRSEDYLGRNISRICEKYLGSKQYANIMMLGFAFQKGLIPVSMHSMAWAIKDTIRTDFRKNLYAFNMGRKLVVQRDLFRGAPERTEWRDVLEERCRWTIRRYRRGHRLADELRELAAGTMNSVGQLDEPLKRALVVRLYDCMRWGGIEYARRYAEKVCEIYAKDGPQFGYAATRAVLFNLAGAMLVKDAVFLAELASSPEKYACDREKYNVNPANGDRIRYRHLWHRRITIGRRSFTLDLTVYNWMLQILKRSRWLRSVVPGWSKTQRRFLQRYESLVADFSYSSAQQYHDRVRSLSAPQCMECMSPRCKEAGCPLASDIPQWLQLAYQGRWRQAAEALHAGSNFPEFTAEICPAMCQSACKQQLNGFAVRIQEMEKEIVERAFQAGWVVPQPPAARTNKRVAVVGSGPAGLAAAQQLARAGHDVTVFEKDDLPGGLLRYGIPAFRLQKDLIDRRLAQLKAEGVAFNSGVEVGRDVSAAELREKFDAVLLAVGAARPRDLNVPGRDRQGVHFALDYLRQDNRLAAGAAGSDPAVCAKGKIVAVIGGGLTGMDCVETALHQGAKEVYQFEILPREALAQQADPFRPDLPEEFHRRWCISTKRFGGDAGRLSDLTAVRVEWVPSANGQEMREIPESEFRMKVDLALLALGFDPVVDPALAGQFGLATDGRGAPIIRDCATSVEGVFAAGDVVTGASYVVTAVSSGRKAAEKVEQYLAKVPQGVA
ncbi:MAG TPA: glutamate synthase small subunit, partial [Phycisphaerae bacterium]|nr:glutamate synthase small subunit [Phycisphaerae bacterium]